jgi:hypothetical protein
MTRQGPMGSIVRSFFCSKTYWKDGGSDVHEMRTDRGGRVSDR